ncbi:MAG: Glu/Leu/Phe/Val dehydrogenase dimerization domain-containing protein [Xanthomonadales bacterium]|nr:Glu/Leu/Phe/Val dehydrogenase dimerization domain-containing protein [Xanthomonadales bacterium]
MTALTDIHQHPEFDGHEHVAFVSDPAADLRGIIAIHNSRGSFAGGGIRMQPYPSAAEALTDVLRLSRAMTYKLAVARLPVGGAKSVIIGDPGRDKSPELLAAFATAVERLGGYYRCGGDVGISAADMTIIREHTRFTPPAEVGDLGRVTADGVFQAIRAGIRQVYRSDGLEGIHVAVQGLGQVGARLCGLLAEAGARLTVADPVVDRVQQVVENTGAATVAPEDILASPCEVFSPCALGGVLNAGTVPALRTQLVCGAANNQLLDASTGELLMQHQVTYVPDFVANAGGVIGGLQVDCGYSAEESAHRVAGIYDTVLEILDRSEQQGIPTHAAAEQLARDIMRESDPDG